jgi:hypothetical protein
MSFFLGLNVCLTQLSLSDEISVECGPLCITCLHGPADSATRPLTFDGLVYRAPDDRISC